MSGDLTDTLDELRTREVEQRIRRAANPYCAFASLARENPDLARAIYARHGSSRRMAEALGYTGHDVETRARNIRKLFGADHIGSKARRRAEVSAKQSELADLLHKALLRNRDEPLSLSDLCDLMDRGPGSIRAALQELRDSGVQIAVRDVGDEITATIPSAPYDYTPPQSVAFTGTEVVMGVVSDTHLGSVAAAEDLLHGTYDQFAREGVSIVLHCGDADEGPGCRGYKGHQNDVREDCQTWTGIEEYCRKHYPHRTGMTTWVISSSKSHTGWEYAASGRDVWANIAHGRGGMTPVAPRDDIHYLGQDVADITLGPDDQTRVRLFHPDGGCSYSIEYKLRKFVEAIPGGNKPHVLLVGHYHQCAYAPIRNVETFAVPCMQWPTKFFSRWGKEPVLGALILRATMDPDGSLVALDQTWLRHYYVSGEPHAR